MTLTIVCFGCGTVVEADSEAVIDVIDPTDHAEFLAWLLSASSEAGAGQCASGCWWQEVVA